MWNLKVAPCPAGKELKNTIIDMKKEIKMSFLKDVFQTADEIKQNEEKFKSAVEASFHQMDTLVRPYLSEAQNETLSEILEGLVASIAEHSFQIGYSSAMQTLAEIIQAAVRRAAALTHNGSDQVPPHIFQRQQAETDILSLHRKARIAHGFYLYVRLIFSILAQIAFGEIPVFLNLIF